MGTHFEFGAISFDFHVLTTQGHRCKIQLQELDKYLKYIGIDARVDERGGFEIISTSYLIQITKYLPLDL